MFAVGAVYDRPRPQIRDIAGGHRPPLQTLYTHDRSSTRTSRLRRQPRTAFCRASQIQPYGHHRPSQHGAATPRKLPRAGCGVRRMRARAGAIGTQARRPPRHSVAQPRRVCGCPAWCDARRCRAGSYQCETFSRHGFLYSFRFVCAPGVRRVRVETSRSFWSACGGVG